MTAPAPHPLSASDLRKSLLSLAEEYVTTRNLGDSVYRSLGKTPTVLFHPYPNEGKTHHGNFHPESYRQLTENPEWSLRLNKPHSQRSRSLDTADQAKAMELDSCTSSDALLMNIFCHPSTIANPAIARLFGLKSLPVPRFGFQPHLPLAEGKLESRSTEIDLYLKSDDGSQVIVEAKLTEKDFTQCSKSRIEGYRDFSDVFDSTALPAPGDYYKHYQLLRNVLAAEHLGASFFLLCDRRRQDLLDAWEAVSRAIKLPELRNRCAMLTWQEIAAASTSDLREFLAEKYGILP
jgi:hypothetical protein